MKRPYREGDWFAVPLGDGRFAAGIVTHGTRNAVGGSFFGPARAAIPSSEELADLRPEEALWRGRFFDRAIAEQRWPVIGHRAGFVRSLWGSRTSSPAADPGLVEQRLAMRVSGDSFEPPRLSVRNLRSPVEPDVPDGAHHRAILAWRQPLATRDLARIEAIVASKPNAAIRVQGAAVEQVNALAAWPSLSKLDVESSRLPSSLATFPHVTELQLDGVPEDMERTIGAFPALQTLRIRARGERVEVASFACARKLEYLEVRNAVVARAGRLGDVASLRALDIEDARLGDVSHLLRMPLRALRLARIASFEDLSDLRDHPTLRTLALVGLLEIDDLNPIASIAQLESLELRGLWQFGIGDVAFVRSMPSLRRLHVDIGGRRKNAEIYRHGAYAAPLPFTGR